MFNLPPRLPTRPARKSSWRESIRWTWMVLYRPLPVMIAVSYERPLTRALAFFLVLYGANAMGMVLLSEGAAIHLAGDSPLQTLLSSGMGLGLVAALFLVDVAATHLMARALEGHGTFLGMLGSVPFALAPFLLNAGLALLLALPPLHGAATALQVIGLTVAGAWSLYLYKMAVRETHRFTDIQAMVAVLMPPALLMVVGGLAIFFLAFASILF